MGTDVLDSSALNGGRFARLSPALARIALLVLAVLLGASALVPIDKAGSRSPWQGAVEGPVDSAGRAIVTPGKPYNEDIALYERAIARVAAGENYYDFIVAEHRAFDYPVKPGIAVRLPTLAYFDAALGPYGQMAAAIALMLAIIAVWWRKLGEGADDAGQSRRMGTALVAVAASLQLNRDFFPLHELWAGGLIALSFGLHRMGCEGRNGRWVAAFGFAALALAIRELALPYVLLMAAFALSKRNWPEAAAWGALVLAFAAGLAWHLSIIAQQAMPSDPHGPPWLVMRGLSGWLGNVVQASNLRWLPHYIAGPAAVLMTFGWLGWRNRAGLFGFLLSAGYGLAFMVIGRWDNFYWGFMIAPAMFAGLAFVPAALAQLGNAAKGHAMPPTPN